MAIAGDENQELADRSVPLVDNYIDLPEEDPQESVQHANVVSFCDRATEGVYEFIKNAIIGYSKTIKSPDEQSLIHHFLRFFDEEIQKIIQNNVHAAGDNALSWKVADECYKEAISPSGILNADRYFNDVKNSLPRRRADSVSGNQDHVFNDKRKREWIDSWVTILNRAPSGLTLFYPRTSNDIDLTNPKTIPPYLFRVFDMKSSGNNDEEVMASSIHASQVRTSGVNDLLGMEDVKATRLLSYHIDPKWRRKYDDQDNLVSWTSSLLYAVQYATYRKHHLRLKNADINICMVQTSQFPQRQFVRDIESLKKYLPIAKDLEEEVEKGFRRRLYQPDFYNGEYFSQGVLNHAGRSCVVSLEQLEDAGIFKLYPALENPRDDYGVIRNVLKVLGLRREWSNEQTTTENDVPDALSIARKCFPGFNEYDVACILLAFKHRELSDGLELTTNRAPSWANKLVEVNRYWQILETRRHLREDLGREVYLQHDIYKVTGRSSPDLVTFLDDYV